MEVVDFYPKTFQEIPEQDNPAFDNDNRRECAMIVKSAKSDQLDHAVVLHIFPEPESGDTVTHIAVFWRHDRAVKYAEIFEPIGYKCVECGKGFDPIAEDECRYCGNVIPF